MNDKITQVTLLHSIYQLKLKLMEIQSFEQIGLGDLNSQEYDALMVTVIEKAQMELRELQANKYLSVNQKVKSKNDQTHPTIIRYQKWCTGLCEGFKPSILTKIKRLFIKQDDFHEMIYGNIKIISNVGKVR